MSRSLGDLIAKQAGVISQPHKATHVLHPTDRALILASDGLWDFAGNEETGSVALSTNDTWDAAARLARLARSRWLSRTYGADDTTVVIVRFGNAPGPTSVQGGGGSSAASVVSGASSTTILAASSHSSNM
jgi:serine/threonine protein phosphatase PrpC